MLDNIVFKNKEINSVSLKDLRDIEQGIINFIISSYGNYLIIHKLLEKDFFFTIHKVIFSALKLKESIEIFLYDSFIDKHYLEYNELYKESLLEYIESYNDDHSIISSECFEYFYDDDIIKIFKINKFIDVLLNNNINRDTMDLQEELAEIIFEPASKDIKNDVEILKSTSKKVSEVTNQNHYKREVVIRTAKCEVTVNYIGDTAVDFKSSILHLTVIPDEFYMSFEDTMKKISLLDFDNDDNEISIEYYGKEKKLENIKKVSLEKDLTTRILEKLDIMQIVYGMKFNPEKRKIIYDREDISNHFSMIPEDLSVVKKVDFGDKECLKKIFLPLDLI